MDAPLFRVEIEPSPTNGLQGTSRLMVDKLSTVSLKRAGYRIGHLDSVDLVRVERAVLVFLGMA